MVCHGELALLKPDPSRLTAFYLAVSAGGALGGAFVGLAAPHWFAGFFELHLGLLLCPALVLLSHVRDPRLAPVPRSPAGPRGPCSWPVSRRSASR
jgi:hypothetical protein